MMTILQSRFTKPFLMALTAEWGVQYFFANESLRQKVLQYIQSTFRSLPTSMRTIIFVFCFLFLFSARCLTGKGFCAMTESEAIAHIQKWRRSYIPGCSQLIQLFENLIALSMFANGMSNEFNQNP